MNRELRHLRDSLRNAKSFGRHDGLGKPVVKLELYQTAAQRCADAIDALMDKEKKWLAVMHEVEQTLGKALGYPELYPYASLEDDGTVCVGDHVPETLATEAARRLQELKRQLETLQGGNS